METPQNESKPTTYKVRKQTPYYNGSMGHVLGKYFRQQNHDNGLCLYEEIAAARAAAKWVLQDAALDLDIVESDPKSDEIDIRTTKRDAVRRVFEVLMKISTLVERGAKVAALVANTAPGQASIRRSAITHCVDLLRAELRDSPERVAQIEKSLLDMVGASSEPSSIPVVLTIPLGGNEDIEDVSFEGPSCTVSAGEGASNEGG